MATTKIYGLVAVGPLAHFDSMGRIESKRMFRSMEAAKKYEPIFKELVIAATDNPFNELSHVEKVSIMDYDLLEDESEELRDF